MKDSLVSLSAGSVLAKDGLLNMEAVLRFRVGFEKKLASSKPAVKSAKTKAGVKATVIVPVSTLKDARAVAKAIGEVAGVSDSKASGEKGKFVVTFVGETQKVVDSAVAKGTAGITPTPIGYYVASRKAKQAKFDSAKDKASNSAYLKRRALKVATRKKLSDAVVQILPVFAKGALPKDLETSLNAVIAEVKKHITATDKVRARADKAAGVAREERQAAFGEMAGAVREMLVGAGVKEANIIQSSGIGGASILVKLPNGSVASIGVSTTAAFNNAKKAAAAAE